MLSGFFAAIVRPVKALACFTEKLFAGDESSVDSVVFIGVSGAIAFLGLETFRVVFLHDPFVMREFAESIGIIGASTGTGKFIRDRNPTPQGGQ